MMVVDSNTGVDFFNGVENPHEQRLDAALQQEEDLALVSLIITEVLQGFRTDSGFQRARHKLVSLPVIHPTVDAHVRAARLFRSLRRRGVTVRGAVDCIIAQTGLDFGAELLSPDVDFEQIARHTPLRLWRRCKSVPSVSSTTEKCPAQSDRLFTIAAMIRPASLGKGMGRRNSTTPHAAGSLERQASSPKSLSNVSRMRRSRYARESTS
jgi:predicted nucleic acid-binding protein